MGNDLVRPTADLGFRMAEHGRIRMGIKTGKAMKSIDTWRFTSADEEAIRHLAEIYGGTPKPWNDPKANPPNQWEVITRADKVRVFIPPAGLSIWYELWSGGGCQRRCDGVTVQIAVGDEMRDQPCICDQKGRMVCRPHTRLNVIIPEIAFGGVWRLESHGWTAAQELPAMEAVLMQLQASSQAIVEALLCNEAAQSAGGRKKYQVPRIKMTQTPQQMLTGEGGVHALAKAEPRPELEQRTGIIDTKAFDLDDEVIEAEVVESPPDIDPPAGTPLSNMEKRLVIVCNEAATRAALDADFLRHALARKASRGRTASSRELTGEEQSTVIELATSVADGDATVSIIKEEPPAIDIVSV